MFVAIRQGGEAAPRAPPRVVARSASEWCLAPPVLVISNSRRPTLPRELPPDLPPQLSISRRRLVDTDCFLRQRAVLLVLRGAVQYHSDVADVLRLSPPRLSPRLWPDLLACPVPPSDQLAGAFSTWSNAGCHMLPTAARCRSPLW